MRNHTQRFAAAFALMGIYSGAIAQPTAEARALKGNAPKPAATPEKKELVQVEINGSSDYDPRRDDTASKTVIRQEEILKYGDTNVFDVLKRAPGVTVIGESIRMRGLGNGYTQVLVNGERPPPGFLLQSVAPEQIERIEIVRAATAEFSTRAIAGTINVVLKRVVSKPQRDLRFNVMHSEQGNNGTVIGTLADRRGDLSYFINAMAVRNDTSYFSSLTEQLTALDGAVMQLRDSNTRNDSRQTLLTVAPRLTWKQANNGLLTLGATLSANRFNGDYATAYTNRIGNFPAPNYLFRNGMTENSAAFLSTNVNWVTQIAGGKLDMSASVTQNNGSADARWLSSTINRQINLLRDSDSDLRSFSARSNGKYARTVFEGHSLAIGWDLSRQRSREERHRVEGFIGAVPVEFQERFSPVVVQTALFAQDEWNINKQWSMYLGARWEEIQTDSEVSGRPDTRSRSRVLSPIAQTLYKFPDKSGRQLRLALTRTYKAPTVDQLTARRNEADLNTRFSPDNSGNPDLKPELATGVDVTYEHFWAPAAVWSVSLSNRHITDYIRTTLSQDRQGRWLYQPVNDGKAEVRSVVIEVKFPSKALWPALPAIDLRGNINRNWSQVSAVPGPDNRLDQQIPLTATLGMDYKKDPYTVGVNFAFRSGGPVRISTQQSTRLQARRDLDAYLLYKINPKVQVRFGANNLFATDNETTARYADSNGISENWGRSINARRWLLNLEMKL